MYNKFIKALPYLLIAILMVLYVGKREEVAVLSKNINRFQEQRDSIKSVNDSLYLRESQFKIISDSLFVEISQIKAQKDKIKLVYNEKIKRIDGSSANDLVSGFSELFAKHDVE